MYLFEVKLYMDISHDHAALLRLDQKRKELLQQKEDLLKESRAKVSTLDNVKSQIELLVKVRYSPGPVLFY